MTLKLSKGPLLVRRLIGMAEVICFKVAFLGDPAVGKTSLFRRYTRDTFDQDYKATIGAQWSIMTSNTKYGVVKLQIWDLASSHRFQYVQPMYLSGAAAVILVYDLTRKSTLFNIPRHVEITKKGVGNTLMYLVGNKLDLIVDDGKVSPTVFREDIESATEYLNELQTKYGLDDVIFYTSAKSGKGVEDLFAAIIQDLAKKFAVPEGG